MHTMRVWSPAVIIAAVLIIGFVLSVPRVRDLGGKSPVDTSTPYSPVVYVHDVYTSKKGTHAITAKISLPDACTTISGEASAAPGASASSTDVITLALDMPDTSGVCLEEPATTTLTFNVSAGKGAVVTATINGTNASTTSY